MSINVSNNPQTPFDRNKDNLIESPLNGLPTEVLVHIFNNLSSASDLCHVSQTSRKFNTVISTFFSWKLYFAIAKQTAESVRNASARASALGGIAVAQAKAGDISGAKQTAKSIENADARTWALRGIAVAQAKAGDISGAKKTAESITDAYARALALKSIAVAQAKAGDILGATQTAESIKNAFTRASALANIAQTMSARSYHP